MSHGNSWLPHTEPRGPGSQKDISKLDTPVLLPASPMLSNGASPCCGVKLCTPLPECTFSTSEGNIFIPSFNSVTVSKLSLGSIAKPVLGVGTHFPLCSHIIFIIASVLVGSRIKEPDVMYHTCNPIIQAAVTGSSGVQGQP